MTSRVHIDVDAFISSDDDDNSTSNSSSFKSGGGGEDGGSNANATLIPTTSSVVHQSNIRTSDRERREHSLSQSRAIAVEGIDEMTDNSPTQSGAIAEDMTAIVSRSRFLPARYHDSFYKHMHGLSRQLSPSSSVDNVDALTETPTAAIYPSHHQEQPALLPDVSHLDRYSSLPVASLVVAGSPPPSNNPAVPTIDDSKTQATHRRWRIVALVIALFVVSIFVAITLGLLFVRPLLESSASVPVPQQQSQPPIIAPVEGVSVAPSSFPVPSPTVKPTIRPVASNLPTTAPQKTEQPTIPAPKKVTNVPLPQKVTNAPLSTAPIMNLTTFAPSSRAPVTTALPATAAPAFSPSSVAPRDVFLINCGSNQDFTDSNGRIWMSDRYFGNGVARTSTSSVLNESNAVLYQTYRESLDWEELTYSIPVPEGEYNVVMHFAETVYVDSSLVCVRQMDVSSTLTGCVACVLLVSTKRTVEYSLSC